MQPEKQRTKKSPEDSPNLPGNTPEKSGNPDQKNGFSLGGRVKKFRRELEVKREKRDIFFTEPLTKSEPEEPVTMVRGGIDIPFLLIVCALLGYGAVMVYSASSVYGEQYMDNANYYILRHLMFMLFAIGISVPFVLRAKPWVWRFLSMPIYIGAVLLLLLVLVIGREGGGAQRWIAIGPLSIQPSEIAKLAVVLVLAAYLSDHEKEVNSRHKFGGSLKHGVLIPGLMLGLILALVLLEKHISGLMIIGMIGISMMFLGGTRMRYIVFIAGAVAAVGCLLVLVSDYAQDRVNTWLYLEQVDPLGSAWQTLQGLYAIGSGNLFGLGLGNSRQKYGYVSQPQNDFIFTIVCEELGFVGALIVVVLFALLLWRGFKIASKAPDRFSSLVVYGLCIKVVLQAVLNIAVVTNSMPNTGISLPFFSYGGTALALQIFEMAIVLSISRYSAVKQ